MNKFFKLLGMTFLFMLVVDASAGAKCNYNFSDTPCDRSEVGAACTNGNLLRSLYSGRMDK